MRSSRSNRLNRLNELNCLNDSALDPRYKDMSLFEKIRNYGSLIRFSHTVFALPFALASVALAWPSHPVTLRVFFWI